MSLEPLPYVGSGLGKAGVRSLLACFRAKRSMRRLGFGTLPGPNLCQNLAHDSMQRNLVRRQREGTVPKFIKLTDRDWGHVTISADRIILYRRSKESYTVVELDGRLTLNVEQTPDQIGDQIATAIQH